MPTTNLCVTVQRTDAFLYVLTTSQTLDYRIDFVRFTSNGFVLDTEDAPASALQLPYIAMKGGQYDVGSFAKLTTSTGTQSVTTGFRPAGIFFFTGGKTAATTIQDDAQWVMGTAASSLVNGCFWAENRTSVINTDCNRYSAPASSAGYRAIVLATGATTLAEARIDTFDASGFTLRWVKNDAVATEIHYAAFGNNATGAPPSDSTSIAAAMEPNFYVRSWK